MRKKTIVILFSIGLGLALVASAIFAIGGAVLGSATASCDAATTYCNAPAETGGFTALLVLGVLGITVGSVLTMISWIAVLIKQAQRQQWVWFVCTLFFSSLCILLWLIIEPEVPRMPQFAPVYQPGQMEYPSDYSANEPYPSAQQPPYYQDPYRPQP